MDLGFAELTIGALAEDAAGELLAAWAGRPVDQRVGERIVAETGGQPAGAGRVRGGADGRGAVGRVAGDPAAAVRGSSGGAVPVAGAGAASRGADAVAAGGGRPAGRAGQDLEGGRAAGPGPRGGRASGSRAAGELDARCPVPPPADALGGVSRRLACGPAP